MTEHPGIAAVQKWSLTIHGRGSERHVWAMAAVAALVAGDEPPRFPGRDHLGTGERRLETIQRIIQREADHAARSSR